MSPAGVSAASLAGLKPEQIAQLMQMEATKEQLRLGTIGQVYDALYKQATMEKIREETRLAPGIAETKRIEAEIKALEYQRKLAKDVKDIEKIDAEVKKLGLEKEKLERLKGYIAKYGDRVVNIPGVGRMSLGHILDFRPELIDKFFATEAREMEERKFTEKKRKELRDYVLKLAGVSDLAGLDPKIRDQVLDVQRRAESYWRGGLSTTEAGNKAWKEMEKSFKALKSIREIELKSPEVISSVREAVKAETPPEDIMDALVKKGWSKEEARDIIRWVAIELGIL